MNLAVPVKIVEVADVVELNGDLIAIESNTGFPPGARVRFDLNRSTAGNPLWLNGKITSVKAAKGGRFAIRVRLHSLTVEHRAALKKWA
jgi:hypothetical protein